MFFAQWHTAMDRHNSKRDKESVQMKTMTLVCAAMLTFTASGFGMQWAGWFNKLPGRGEPRQVKAVDVMHGEDAIRYRHNQGNAVHLLPIYH
jgi:hypothetical protein